MLACVDVHYRDNIAVAGCVLFRDWSDNSPAEQLLVSEGPAAPYLSGEFYLRELPPVLKVLSQVEVQLKTVVVDGYVWLNASRNGLGAHLYSALGGKVPVIGVAKNVWRAKTQEPATEYAERRTIPVIRGASNRPLYVTTAGIDVVLAAQFVAAMHGRFRIPTLLAAVDTLVRSIR